MITRDLLHVRVLLGELFYSSGVAIGGGSSLCFFIDQFSRVIFFSFGSVRPVADLEPKLRGVI
jgi:hypothetical protein